MRLIQFPPPHGIMLSIRRGQPWLKLAQRAGGLQGLLDLIRRAALPAHAAHMQTRLKQLAREQTQRWKHFDNFLRS